MFELSVPIWQYFWQSWRELCAFGDCRSGGDLPAGEAAGLYRPKNVIFMLEMNR